MLKQFRSKSTKTPLSWLRPKIRHQTRAKFCISPRKLFKLFCHQKYIECCLNTRSQQILRMAPNFKSFKQNFSSNLNSHSKKIHSSQQNHLIILRIIFLLCCTILSSNQNVNCHEFEINSMPNTADSASIPEAASSQTSAVSCFGGLQTFEKISMSTFENPSIGSSGSFGSGILIQQDDQALTSECVNLCRSQSNCLSFVIDYNKFECKSYATTQQELHQEFIEKFQATRQAPSSSNSSLNINSTDSGGYQASSSTAYLQHLLPSASSNYFEKICLDGVANRNQFGDVCGQGRLWTIERVVDSFLDGYVEKEVTNVNNKDECSKLCIFENQFVCRSADYDHQSRLCRLSKEDRRTQPQAMRFVAGSNRQYLENQCASPGPSSCVYETKKNLGIISMDALKFAQTTQDCQMKCNQESTFNCRSYSFHQQRCFLSGDDSSSLNSNLVKLPVKHGWQFGEKKCLVELCTKGIFSYERISGFTLRSALSTPIDLITSAGSSMSVLAGDLKHESSYTRLRHLSSGNNGSSSSVVSTMMMMMMPKSGSDDEDLGEIMQGAESSTRHQKNANNNLAITEHCRHSCDLGYLNCPAFTIDYRNNRCQRLDRNSQGRHLELIARDGFAYYEKICLRVPEIMSMCQDKYWIFERVIGYELAPRLYEKSLKFVQSRRDCQEYCLEEKQFQCRSALYNDETSDCKLSRYNRRLATEENGFYRNFNARISYLENNCIRDHAIEKKQCRYEQAKDEPAYPTFTEHIEMVPSPKTSIETESLNDRLGSPMNATTMQNYGISYCEQLCNDNAKFECNSFGYYGSTAQCFLSGDDTISAGETAVTTSTGFLYFEKKCRLQSQSQQNEHSDYSTTELPMKNHTHYEHQTTTTSRPQTYNPYFQPSRNNINQNLPSSMDSIDNSRPIITNSNNVSIHIDQHQTNINRPKLKPSLEMPVNETSVDADQYKCGHGHSFVYQRISGFEPIGGFLTLLVKDNDKPGIIAECADLCKKAFECRAFVIDYENNQCFAMIENSSIGMLNLRQSLGKDYFEGFCLANHILLSGYHCKNKTWIVDKIVDQAVIGVQHHKLIQDSDRTRCRQACLEERLFWCKSALFDGSTGDCKLYSIDRESISHMRLLFTKGVDFFENQCQIASSSCPYDPIERDLTIITATKSLQAGSTFDCEHSCNTETSFNCRSYTYLEQNPSLLNMCILSSDSRTTSQRGSIRQHQRALYAERNCFFRRPRYPGNTNEHFDSSYSPNHQPSSPVDPYQQGARANLKPPMVGGDRYNPLSVTNEEVLPVGLNDASMIVGHGCEPHQFTFELTFGYDYRLGQKERAPITPAVGLSIACQQECLRRGERCQSFVVDYSLPYQSCFLIDSQVGANKKLLIKSSTSAYFEKVCLPRTGIDSEALTLAQLSGNQHDSQSMDINPSFSQDPWKPQVPNQLPYYLQLQQLVQNYPSRSCAKLWTFERFVNHNFTAPSDKTIENCLTKVACETHCLNEASFNCRSVTYDYLNKICRLFKSTRRTIMSQFHDLESMTANPTTNQASSSLNTPQATNIHPGTVHILDAETLQTASSQTGDTRRQEIARQVGSQTTGEASEPTKNIDYFENTCLPEPSSCQYRQFYDQFSPYIDKINHAVSLSDCQRQCDLERLFSCKAVNYDPASRSCMLLNEDLISLNSGHQTSLLPKKNTIYSEKGNCEMISVQCNSQEMMVNINFDSPFRGRVMAKGNPEQCFLIGDGQTSIQFPIVFGPKCNSRQEGHNTFVNEVVIQQHPVIMTDNDKTIRVMCAFEAPDQTITLKNPTSRDNKTGIDVGTTDSSRTRHDKQPFSSVVSNKAAPPSVLLRILDPNGRDASMINLGDDLILKIQMQMDGQNSALGIFARNLAARSSNGESLLLIDNDGCPVDPQVFPSLEIDPKDGKSLQSTFKAFRFPSSGLVNFEVQIRFCPEKCEPVDCHRGLRSKSYGRKKRNVEEMATSRTSIIQSLPNRFDPDKSSIEALSTVMKPGKAFQYVRELLFKSKQAETNDPNQTSEESKTLTQLSSAGDQQQVSEAPSYIQDFNINQETKAQVESEQDQSQEERFLPTRETSVEDKTVTQIDTQTDEGIPPTSNYLKSKGLVNGQHHLAPYGRIPIADADLNPGTKQATMKHEKYPIESEEPQVATPSFPVESSDTASTLSSVQESLTPGADKANSITETSFNDDNLNTPIDPSLLKKEHKFDNDGKTTGTVDVPLRFSILVGENQAPSGEQGWLPINRSPPLIMNSSSVDLDHIVVQPGKDGHLEQAASTDSKDQFNGSQSSVFNDDKYSDKKKSNELSAKRNISYEHNFDTLPPSSIDAELSNSQIGNSQFGQPQSIHRLLQPSEIAVSHDCQLEASRSKLRTILWTGSLVIVFNVCLVILSLFLYFKRVHLRKNHTIVRSYSECGTQSSNSENGWPSVLLKSKNSLGTSLNTHEHFFYKLNAKQSHHPSSPHDFNWPNFSSSSKHSTVSSLAEPLAAISNVKIDQSRGRRVPYETQNSLRSHFIASHKSLTAANSYEGTSASLHATYTNNIDESHPDKYENIR